MTMHEPKYEPLSRHLGSATRPITMTFDQISRLVGGLPPSASRHAAWWANDRTHVQARAWLALGLRVQEVDLERQVVQFS